MKVLVTGGTGFLGHHLMKAFEEAGIEAVAFGGVVYNLLQFKQAAQMVYDEKPQVIVHAAAICGGIGANKDSPADFISSNIRMGCNVFDAATAHAVPYFYTLGSVCSYPKHCPIPFREDDIWNGFPEKTNAAYGTAKRAMMVMQNAYRDQWGLKGACLIPVNMYGEHDHFDLRNSHVIPALIRKIATAIDKDESTVEVWGSGKATREFLYAGDCAEAIVRAVETQLDYDKPINIGTGNDISIQGLVEMIAGLMNYQGLLVFLGDDIDGQPKRRLDVSRAKEVLGFEAKTSLKDGLKKTIDWYLQEKHENR
jgi:GDP-L-fucose synthase